MARVEDALAQRIAAELIALGVPRKMVVSEVKCGSGRIDLVVYTQPRCLIELKAILDSKVLDKAIKQVLSYRREYPGSRLFIGAQVLKINEDLAIARLKRRGIGFWTQQIASDIALECQQTPPEWARPQTPRARRQHTQLSPEHLERYVRLATKGSYRTLRRQLAFEEAVQAIPAEDREEARIALTGLGGHKASVLAPLLRHHPTLWRENVDKARWQSERALQRLVTETLNLKSRGGHLPGESWYKLLLGAMPKERRSEVAAVFDAAFQATGSTDAITAFLRIVDAARPSFLQPPQSPIVPRDLGAE